MRFESRIWLLVIAGNIGAVMGSIGFLLTGWWAVAGFSINATISLVFYWEALASPDIE